MQKLSEKVDHGTFKIFLGIGLLIVLVIAVGMIMLDSELDYHSKRLNLLDSEVSALTQQLNAPPSTLHEETRPQPMAAYLVTPIPSSVKFVNVTYTNCYDDLVAHCNVSYIKQDNGSYFLQKSCGSSIVCVNNTIAEQCGTPLGPPCDEPSLVAESNASDKASDCVLRRSDFVCVRSESDLYAGRAKLRASTVETFITENSSFEAHVAAEVKLRELFGYSCSQDLPILVGASISADSRYIYVQCGSWN